jgi:hypothetical protein
MTSPEGGRIELGPAADVGVEMPCSAVGGACTMSEAGAELSVSI